MKKKLVVLSGLVLALPVLAFAQQQPCPAGTLFGVLCTIGRILSSIVPILIALGVVYFIWGVISYILSSDEEAKKAGRNKIIYGIIGLAVIVGMWGLVNILGTTFGVGSNSGLNSTITTPIIPIPVGY